MGSKCLLVTASPGVGKTTLIMRVFQNLKLSNPNLKIQGFYTREVRDQGGERVGFELVTVDGRTAPLALTPSNSTVSPFPFMLNQPLITLFSKLSTPSYMRWPNVGKYKVDVASFESLALPELQIRQDTDLFIIDEVGKMELFSSSFFPAVLKLLESDIPLLASIPIPKSGQDIPAVARLRNHPSATMFTLSSSNRDSIREQIYPHLVDILRKK